MIIWDPKAAIGAARRSVQARMSDPLSYQRYSAWQKKFLADGGLFRVLRAANQVGKTYILCADLLHDLRGTNPFRPRRYTGPMLTMLMGKSIEQMSMAGSILDELWQMIPSGEVHPKLRYERGRGIRGTKNPLIEFVSGPAKGSIVSIRTEQQDPETYAGVTLHRVDVDEPMEETRYGEVAPRLWKHDGALTIAFTPTINMPPQKWLRDLGAKVPPAYHEHHVCLVPENTLVEDFAAPFYGVERIELMRAATLAPQVPMRFEAAWDPVYEDQYLSAYHSGLVRPFSIEEIPHDAIVLVGTDHGLVVRKQWSVLVAVSGHRTAKPVYWIIGEAGGLEVASPDQDAKSILAMLSDLSLIYDHVDRWVGDRDTGDGRMMASKSNGDLRKALARQLRKDPSELRYIHTPHKYDGSVEHGFGLMNVAMLEGRLKIHPRCVKFAEACGAFRGGRKDKSKDILDAARYAIEHAAAMPEDDVPIRGASSRTTRR